MHRSILLLILVLLPNTTLRDWQRAAAPNLHELMQEGAVALMNDRTAERDKITAIAGAYSFGAGARMNGAPDTSSLSYSARADNLYSALTQAGVSVSATDTVASAVLGAPHNSPILTSNAKVQAQFEVVTFGSDWPITDNHIGRLMKRISDVNGLLMVASPNPAPRDYRTDRQLTPLLLWGPHLPPGFLTSPSTHHSGLVTNTDIAPTIAAMFGAKLPVMPFGGALSVVPSGTTDTVSTLAALEETWIVQSRSLHALPYLAGAMALLIGFTSFFKPRLDQRVIGAVVVFLALLPLVLLFSSSSVELLSLSLSAAGGAYWLCECPNRGVAYAAAVTTVILLLDMLFLGDKVSGNSLLGYSPIEGARYYGVGNETMGTLIGCGVVLTAWLIRYSPGRIWVGMMWLLIGFSLAWPTAGAKAGGLLVVSVVVGIFVYASSSAKLRSPWVVATAVTSLGVGLALLWMIGHFGPRTHISQAEEMVHAQGSTTLFEILARKAAMDSHLVFHSAWVWVFGACLSGIYCFVRRGGDLSWDRRVVISTGLMAAAASASLNDAGVVAAALCALYVWAYCCVELAVQSPPVSIQQTI